LSVIFAWTGFAVHKKSKHAKDQFNLSSDFAPPILSLAWNELWKWATIFLFFKIHYFITGGLLGIIFTIFIIVTPLLQTREYFTLNKNYELSFL
jgi:hypothetical protein